MLARVVSCFYRLCLFVLKTYSSSIMKEDFILEGSIVFMIMLQVILIALNAVST